MSDKCLTLCKWVSKPAFIEKKRQHFHKNGVNYEKSLISHLLFSFLRDLIREISVGTLNLWFSLFCIDNSMLHWVLPSSYIKTDTVGKSFLKNLLYQIRKKKNICNLFHWPAKLVDTFYFLWFIFEKSRYDKVNAYISPFRAHFPSSTL